MIRWCTTHENKGWVDRGRWICDRGFHLVDSERHRCVVIDAVVSPVCPCGHGSELHGWSGGRCLQCLVTGPTTPCQGDRETHIIQIDRRKLNVLNDQMTGTELRHIVAVPDDRDLWRVIPGENDQIVGDDESVYSGVGARFFTIPKVINASQTNGQTISFCWAHYCRVPVNADTGEPMEQCWVMGWTPLFDSDDPPCRVGVLRAAEREQ